MSKSRRPQRVGLPSSGVPPSTHAENPPSTDFAPATPSEHFTQPPGGTYIAAQTPASFASYYSTPVGRPSSYPTFMSFEDTAKLHLEWMKKGIMDAMRLDRVFRLVVEDREIGAHALKSFVLNTLSLISVLVFDFFIEPLLDPKHQSFINRNFGLLYQSLWLAPIVGISLYFNTSWCSVIANRAFALRHGRKASVSSSYSGMLTQIASSAYRIILIFSYLVLTFLLSYIPYIGSLLSFFYVCWVNSYYCFEYIWVSRGMSLSQRVRHQEERWSYYLAFGFPSAIVCMWGSTLANAAIFALFFPSFIITAMHATPVPLHPWVPVPGSQPAQDSMVSPDGFPVSASARDAQASAPIPNPLIPVRLPIFAPVIKMNDIVVDILTVGGITNKRRGKGAGTLYGDGEMVGAEEGAGMDSRAGYPAFETAPSLQQYGTQGLTGGLGQTTRIRRKKVQ